MFDWSLLLYPACAILGAIITAIVTRRLTFTPLKLNGDSLTNGLRAFNEWRDDFLIELSTLMLMFGFIVGTVDVFTSGGLSGLPVFNYSWAIIQAIAIDGLFFAIWGRIKRATWDGKTWFNNLMLIVVGLLLAVVASLVNGLLSYQELNNITDVAQAMTNLGVDQGTFTYARAILVVLVSVLVALFGRTYSSEKKAIEQQLSVALADVASEKGKNETLQATAKELQATIDKLRGELRAIEEKAIARKNGRGSRAMTAQDEQAIAIEEKAMGYGSRAIPEKAIALEEKAMGYEQGEQKAMGYGSRAIPEKATGYEQGEQKAIAIEEKAMGDTSTEKATGYVAQDDGRAIAVGDGEGQVFVATGTARDKIKQAMLQAMEDGQELQYGDIAKLAGVGYSTVKKWAGEVKEEIKVELAQSPMQLDKLALTMEALKSSPNLTDEDLAVLLNLKRPASARFWKLKALELLARDPGQAGESERTTDSLESVAPANA